MFKLKIILLVAALVMAFFAQNTAQAVQDSGGAGGVGGTGDLLGGLRSILGTDGKGDADKQIKSFGTLGGLVSQLLNVAFLLSGFLMFVWALMGIFQYITAGGNKEGLAKARARITWAIVGFLFVMVSYLLSTYIQQVIRPKSDTIIPKVSGLK